MSTDNIPTNSSPIEKANPKWREKVLNGLLRGIFIFGLLAALFAINDILRDPLLPQQLKITYAILYAAASTLLGVIAFVPRVPYTIRAGVLLFLFYGLGLAGLTGSGLSGDGRVFILAFIVMAAVLFDMRVGIIALVLGISTLVGIAWLFSTGEIYISPERLANSTSPSSWISGSLVLTLLAVAIIIPVTYLINNLEVQIKKTNSLLQDIEGKQGTLELQVEERTNELEHRTRQLEIASQVAHDALVFQDVNELLSNMTRSISERFGHYHAGIFLLDDKGEYAILQAASSDGGQKMLGRGYQVHVRSENIVGATVAEKRPHIAFDAGSNAVFFNNPDLSGTHSEMALPLLSQGEVVGVLDVQSTEFQAFNQQDIEIFQTLANQLALAIQNARLFDATQTSITQLEALTIKQSQTAWKTHLEHQAHNFLYTPLGIKQLRRQSKFSAGRNEENANIPIMLRGKSIGEITLKRPSQQWTNKEKTLISDVADQVGLAIENARLVDETREQANRDRLISEFSSKLRETLDMDTVVKTAIEEMRKTFNLKEAEVRLNTPD